MSRAAVRRWGRSEIHCSYRRWRINEAIPIDIHRRLVRTASANLPPRTQREQPPVVPSSSPAEPAQRPVPPPHDKITSAAMTTLTAHSLRGPPLPPPSWPPPPGR